MKTDVFAWLLIIYRLFFIQLALYHRESYIYNSNVCSIENMQTIQMPVEKGMDEESLVHLLHGILLDPENGRILPFTTK